MLEIQELKSNQEFQEAFGVMRELRQNLDQETYLGLLPSVIQGDYRPEKNVETYHGTSLQRFWVMHI